jgi:hypothetical protein
MTGKNLPLATNYPPAKVPIVIPERNPSGESPGIGFATCQAPETFGLDLQRAPVTLPSGSHPSGIGSDPSGTKRETREMTSAVYINRVIEVARSRATLISKIREHLLRSETQEAISLVRVLCGLGD